MNNKNSLCYWFPLLEQYSDQIHYPETYQIPLDQFDGMYYMDALKGRDNTYLEKIQNYLLEQSKPIFEKLDFPIFMKTDEYSGKHNWKNTCFLTNVDDFLPHFNTLIEETLLVDFMGLITKSIVFRKYIPMKSTFTFFEGNFPVSQERRYFIKDGKVVCHHPYWDKAVFVDMFKRMQVVLKDRKDADEILKKVDVLNTESNEEIDYLTQQCEIILPSFPEFWSVDFALGQDGIYYLIDMHNGNDSWHPERPFNPEKLNK